MASDGPESKAAEEIADLFDTWGIRTVAEAESKEIICRFNSARYLPLLRDVLLELNSSLMDKGLRKEVEHEISRLEAVAKGGE